MPLLWWLTEDPKLSRNAATAVANATHVLVSPVCAIEIAIKHRVRRLPLSDALVPVFRETMAAEGFELSLLSAEHALRAGSYPAEHRDPFDRLLAAQAEIDDLVLVTRDAEFAQFPCETLW